MLWNLPGLGILPIHCGCRQIDQLGFSVLMLCLVGWVFSRKLSFSNKFSNYLHRVFIIHSLFSYVSQIHNIHFFIICSSYLFSCLLTPRVYQLSYSFQRLSFVYLLFCMLVFTSIFLFHLYFNLFLCVYFQVLFLTFEMIYY